MPQATDKQRALMQKWFGDPISDKGPYEFLAARDWKDFGGLLVPPTPSYNPSVLEEVIIEFLCDEWGYDYEHTPYSEIFDALC